MRVIKECPNAFANIISHLATLSFSSGIFPSQYKTAQITPILKKPNLDPSNPANYRLISNLSTISKIIERLALARTGPNIISSPSYNAAQSAYRKGYSTETALLKLQRS